MTPELGPSARGDQLRILDLCTGTGCIALDLYSRLHKSHDQLEIIGLDVSLKALDLAKRNLRHNIKHGKLPSEAMDRIRFDCADLLDGSLILQSADVVVSNPPYVSRGDLHNGETTRSTRTYEPHIALVPPGGSGGSAGEAANDMFYPRILELAKKSCARLLVMEVGSLEQATRVVKAALGPGNWTRVEIWRDWYDGSSRCSVSTISVEDVSIAVRGEGNGRVVVCWKDVDC